MSGSWKYILSVLVLVSVLAPKAAAGPWICSLPDSAVVTHGSLVLGDLSTTPVPVDAARVSLVFDGVPGTTMTVTRKEILRRLVVQHLAGGVVFRGSPVCVVTFAGRVLDSSQIQNLMRRALTGMLPTQRDGAPETWLELNYDQGKQGIQGEFSLTPMTNGILRPGRQQIRFRFQDGQHSRVVPVNVVVHHFAEMARAGRRLERGSTLKAGDFVWEWVDLAEGSKGRVVGRQSVAGNNIGRTLESGAVLLEQDLRVPPVILAGDPVELKLARGGVSVTVRAFARKAGVPGQTIPVKNKMTGQLVNARVVGPGVVEWRY